MFTSQKFFPQVLIYSIFLFGFSFQVQAGVDLPLEIDGNRYTADLSLNVDLMSQLKTANPDDESGDLHYMGQLVGVDDSWVRVSNIDGQWQGLVSAFQQLHVIDIKQLPQSRNFSDIPKLVTSTLASHDHGHASCALDSALLDQQSLKTSPTSSALVLPSASQIREKSFPDLCSSKVADGKGNEICLISELELAFDQEFQAARGANAQSDAAAMINIVDGIYRNNLNVSFETLSLTMLNNTSDVFSNSTAAGAFLADIRAKKRDNEIPFIKNNKALFHLVTGRDFDGTTAGVAYLGVFCDTNGYSTGTSQYLGSNAITSVVIAHELGHNFGSDHDGSGNACGSGFIMAPSVSNVSNFSTCSKTQIKSEIGNVGNSINACFNFPVDLGITANAGNPTSVTLNQPFNLVFELTPKQASEAIASAAFSASITGGEINSVNIPGQTCTVAANKLSFSCNITNLSSAASATLQVTTSASPASLALTSNVNGADLRDIVSANNQLTVNISASGGGGSDTVPDPFSFTDQANVATNQLIVSNAISVSGIDAASPISVSGGGEYRIGSGAFTNLAGLINNGDQVSLRHTSSSQALIATDTTLTIGGVSDVFTTTTAAAAPSDGTPDPFSFADVSDVPASTEQTSNAITVTGIDIATAISVSGGSYSVNAGAFTSNPASVVNGDSIRVRHTSSAQPLTRTDTILTIGGVQDTYSSITLAIAVDTTPDPYSFTDVSKAALSTIQTSNTITVEGINAPSPISVTGGSYRINNGSFTSTSATVSNGDKVSLRHTSAAAVNTVTTTELTIGGVSASYRSTTVSSTTTNPGGGSGGGDSSGSGSLSLPWLLLVLSMTALRFKTRLHRMR